MEIYGSIHDYLVRHRRTRRLGVLIEILRAPIAAGIRDGLRFWRYLLTHRD